MSLSKEDQLVVSNDPLHPANVICELCSLFFTNGWVVGTGGGISIKSEDGKVFIAPSGVQKERMKPLDMFVIDYNSDKVLRKPELYKPSSCTPLFRSIYRKFEKTANACIHTHSQHAVMVSLLWDKEFRISNMEQIKAFPKVKEPGYLSFYDTLSIPIIENRPHEQDLEEPLQELLEKYPHTIAVIVRRHGLFVWGENIWKAKIYNESIDYLLELALKMKGFGIPTTCNIGEEKHHVDPKLYN